MFKRAQNITLLQTIVYDPLLLLTRFGIFVSERKTMVDLQSQYKRDYRHLVGTVKANLRKRAE